MKIDQIKRIVLASGSPRRKEYLERYQFQFRIVTADIVEAINAGETPDHFVRRMAREKAQAVAPRCDADEVIIAADTIVELDGRVLGKPSSHQHAFRMLNDLNNQTHHVTTAFVVLDNQTGALSEKSTRTAVQFNNHSEASLKHYADSTEPMDKAGAYSIQGVGTFLVRSISGSYNNVVGFPIEQLILDLLEMKIVSVASP